ncbi:MAG: hypothetical protein R6V57_14950 [Vicinamibacterales bacterium]
MTTRLAAVTSWLCAGHAAVASAYWLLLQIPESNAWMLAASLLVLLIGVWLTGVVETAAMLSLQADGPMRGALAPALRRAWLIVFPLGLFAAVWWLTGAAAHWHARYAGQIDAAIIAQTGWTRTGGLHAAAGWLIAAIRWAAGLSLAAAMTAALARDGIAGLRPQWMRRGLRLRPVALTAAALAAGVWWPWQYVYWRPAFLPPNWTQPAFAAVKLAVLFAVAQLAWAIVLWAAARERRRAD